MIALISDDLLIEGCQFDETVFTGWEIIVCDQEDSRLPLCAELIRLLQQFIRREMAPFRGPSPERPYGIAFRMMDRMIQIHRDG